VDGNGAGTYLLPEVRLTPTYTAAAEMLEYSYINNDSNQHTARAPILKATAICDNRWIHCQRHLLRISNHLFNNRNREWRNNQRNDFVDRKMERVPSLLPEEP
jgi:hypothetical protein